MADLEDRILKKNIPGRYSQWNDDDDKRINEEQENGFSDEEQETDLVDTVRKWEQEEIPKPLQLSALSSAGINAPGKSTRTGPKGVLQDYKMEKQRQEHNKAVEKETLDSILHRMAYGATLENGEVSMSQASKLEKDKKPKSKYDKDYDSNSSSDESDDFLKEYRQKRMIQLQQASQWPCFGEITEVDIMDYTSIVDKTDPRVMVVIHMYEPSMRECNKLNMHLHLCFR